MPTRFAHSAIKRPPPSAHTKLKPVNSSAEKPAGSPAWMSVRRRLSMNDCGKKRAYIENTRTSGHTRRRTLERSSASRRRLPRTPTST